MKKLQGFDQNHRLSPLQKCQFCLLFKSMFILSKKACFLTRTSRGLQGITWGYNWLQEVTGGYKGLQGLQEVTGVTGGY